MYPIRKLFNGRHCYRKNTCITSSGLYPDLRSLKQIYPPSRPNPTRQLQVWKLSVTGEEQISTGK